MGTSVSPCREADLGAGLNPNGARAFDPVVHLRLKGAERAVHHNGHLGWKFPLYVLDLAAQVEYESRS